ncbi:tyrosine-type recombinase/integrase [Uliginosibacterium gangwonense]|uniref:tyrosine-type recombinase/integrase n=1 Tax=Uliginosibacterium gangwonense TaxID=392736 RepID=UPI00036E7EE7|nr:site-specific integrase [Uliginosibacterium gangwonense]
MGKQFDGVRAGSASTVEIDFYYAGERCRERIKLEPTPANLKRAALHRAAILDSISRGEFDYSVTFPNSKNAARFAKSKGALTTIASFLDDWLERKAKQLKASTWEDYRKTVNGHLIPKFGALSIGELDRQKVREWCAGLDASNKRIGNILSVLRSALAEAEEDGIIEANPIAGWNYRKVEPPKEEEDVDPFTADEQSSILAELSGQGRNLVQFAFWTGLRTSELVALNWADIDLRAGVVKIRKATTQAAHRRAKAVAAAEALNSVPEGGIEPASQIVETTKTASGRRDVKLLAPALAAIQAQKEHTWLKGEEVFQNPRTGERWTGDQPIRKTLWTHALKRAGIRYRNPYQTRHTYASMLLSAGEHPMWVAQQMGHKDWGMIRRVYGRFIPSADPGAGSRAEQVFGQSLGHDTRRSGTDNH